MARAVEIASAANPRLAALAERLIPRLPYRVQSSDTIKGDRPWSMIEPMIYAIERERVSLNTEEWVNVVVIDCDHDDVERWRVCGLPAPEWIAASENGRHHIGWSLSRPIYTGPGAAPEPVAYLARVRELLNFELNGDPSYGHRLTKNPWYHGWYVQTPGDKAVSLGELYAAVECSSPSPRSHRRRRRPVEENGLGRNCTLFDRVRFWCYERGETDLAEIQAYAVECNDFGLPQREVDHTARSIWKFMTRRWRGHNSEHDTIQRGVMALPDDMPLPAKQAAAAVRSAGENRRKKDVAIEAAIASLRAAGKPVTAAAVVEAAGGSVSLRTVKGRLAALKAAQRPPAVTVPRPALTVIVGGRQRAPTSAEGRAAAYKRSQVERIAAEIRAQEPLDGRRSIPSFALAAQHYRQSG